MDTWTATLKIGLYGYQFRYLVCRAKDKNKIKTYEEKAILAKVRTSNYIFWSGQVLIVNQKWKKIYKLGKLMAEFQFYK